MTKELLADVEIWVSQRKNQNFGRFTHFYRAPGVSNSPIGTRASADWAEEVLAREHVQRQRRSRGFHQRPGSSSSEGLFCKIFVCFQDVEYDLELLLSR